MLTDDGLQVALRSGDEFYQPLLGPRDVRLLEIRPGSEGDPLECFLVTVSFDDNPVYAALSYVWGDATQRVWILCNGKTIAITATLAETLQAFRGFSADMGRPLAQCKK